jgi:polyphosphate kinase
MSRNLERRVELLVPVDDEACRKRLKGILDVFFQDNVKARRLEPDGSYSRVEAPSRKKAVRSQEFFTLQAYAATRRADQDRAAELVPVKPAPKK